MDISTQIRKIMLDEKINIVELAKRLNTSQPNVSAKLKRNNFNIKDLERFCNALGYKVEIIFKKENP
jgi:DNA-binding Xre family transcriptional regulator